MNANDKKDTGESEPVRFADFSRAEWVAALTPAWGRVDAERFTSELFTQISAKGTNGYSLSTFEWALLSRLNASAEARVTALTRYFPAETVAEIARIRREWDRKV